MNLREFFDPETPPTEEVENPEQTHEKDQTDDEVEGKIDQVYGQEDNHDFDGGKEESDDSTEYQQDEPENFDANGHLAPAGDPSELADNAREEADGANAEMQQQSDDVAGMVMLDNEPAGIMSMGGMGGMTGGGMGMGEPPPDQMGGIGGPPKATVDAQDWQLTVEPEADQMPTLSSMMGASNETKPMGDIDSMTNAAQSLLPKQDSTWNDMIIQVGDATINLKKTQQPPPAPPMAGPPQMGPPKGPPQPPMMEKRRNRK